MFGLFGRETPARTEEEAARFIQAVVRDIGPASGARVRVHRSAGKLFVEILVPKADFGALIGPEGRRARGIQRVVGEYLELAIQERPAFVEILEQ